ncbi:unnamed protein product [Parascedosporium putredinis]|uniref:Trehalase n=1 Tax=Parascedosporium putredinis TaxID=1442378 RepID=A0A9P1H7E4_9PEZI|nr:unnamed protein product [Parascedosporium putredinis]CAI7998364.1 unnamed protein product [Parascedosporium putredinis]
MSRPADAADDVYFPLRYLNIVGTVPVDLNSILYGNEIAIAEFLEASSSSSSSSSSDNVTTAAAAEWRAKADARATAMYALMWNDTLHSYFDYNLTSRAQNTFIPADDDAEPFETDPAPPGMQVAFSVAQFYPFWTRAAPAHLRDNPLAVAAAYDRVARYLDLRAGATPATNFRTGEHATSILPLHLVRHRRLHLRDPRLPGLDPDAKGVMFEKYADNATNRAGGGGEYEVVEGFGWTNGVLIWIADTFKNNLTRPDCGDIEAADVHPAERR